MPKSATQQSRPDITFKSYINVRLLNVALLESRSQESKLHHKFSAFFCQFYVKKRKVFTEDSIITNFRRI